MRGARVLLSIGDRSDPESAAALEAAHVEVRTCPQGQPLLREITTFRPDLVVMGLPAGDPSLVSALVRRTHASYRPLVLCCVDDPSTQRAPALEAGADGCLELPCTPADLELHVRVLLRRAPWLLRTVHRVSDLVVDEDAHVVAFRDQPLTLSGKEFGLLAMLAQNAGTILSKQRLLEAIWGYDALDENLVEVHLSCLRKRLPPEARPLVQTVRGVGYVLREDIPQGRPASCR
jgi:DNA-binding response OmpR family regulator